MRRFIFLSVVGLLCFALLACAPKAPKVKRTGLKPINEAYLYPQKGEKDLEQPLQERAPSERSKETERHKTDRFRSEQERNR